MTPPVPHPGPDPRYSPVPPPWSCGALLFCYIGPFVALILTIVWLASL